MTQQRYYSLARQYYNAFKHLTTRQGDTRDDAELLSEFDDYHNDALLFIAWTDFMAASALTPIEAQVFQVWFYASHPEKLARREDADRFLAVFPKLNELPRAQRKAGLRAQIAKARKNADVMADPRTDSRPLILPA